MPEPADDDQQPDDGAVLSSVTITRWIDSDGRDRVSVRCSDGLRLVEGLGLLAYGHQALWHNSE